MDFISATRTWTISLSLAQLRRNIFNIYGSYLNVSCEHGVVINPHKCLFGVSSLNFLGHHIDRQGVTPLQDKVQVVRDFPQPTSQRKLQEFMGLVNFYHRFLPTALNSCDLCTHFSPTGLRRSPGTTRPSLHSMPQRTLLPMVLYCPTPSQMHQPAS